MLSIYFLLSVCRLSVAGCRTWMLRPPPRAAVSPARPFMCTTSTKSSKWTPSRKLCTCCFLSMEKSHKSSRAKDSKCVDRYQLFFSLVSYLRYFAVLIWTLLQAWVVFHEINSAANALKGKQGFNFLGKPLVSAFSVR